MSPVESLQAALSSGSALALPLAFLGGVLVGFNPCCLALYPAVAATCGARGAFERTRVAAWPAAAFVAGTAAATTALGILAAVAGHAVVLLGRWPRYALAFVPLVMGTHLLGWVRLPVPAAGATRPGGGAGTAFVAGLLLALVVGSCGTPALAAILACAAYQGKLFFGAALLFAYGLGNGLPLLLAGTGVGELVRRAGAAAPWMERAAGMALLALGFYLILTVP